MTSTEQRLLSMFDNLSITKINYALLSNDELEATLETMFSNITMETIKELYKIIKLNNILISFSIARRSDAWLKFNVMYYSDEIAAKMHEIRFVTSSII